MNIPFPVVVRNHELVHLSPRMHERWLLTQTDDTYYNMEYVKPQKNRSAQQNKYYWGVVIPMMGEYCGYNQQEMHEALKMKFLRRDHGNGLPTVRSTTVLNTVEFNDYVEEVCRFAAMEFGLVIPDPGVV